MARDAFDAVAELRRAESLPELHECAMTAFRRLGFSCAWGYWLRHDPPDSEVDLRFGDLDHPWCAHYLERGWDKRSPIGRSIGHAPVTWDEIRSRPLPPSERRIFDELAAFGLTEGQLLLVESRGDRRCAVSLAGADFDPRDERATTAAHLISIHYGLAGFAFLHEANDHGPAERARLTPRQVECLRWVRDGKTAWEIGLILNLSSRTVEEHLAKACRILGVRSRFQAVVEASRLGFFQL